MNILHNKKVLGILAHPDDEIIVGWPVFQDTLIERFLLTVCDNSEQGYEHRPEEALREVCKREKINLYHCLSSHANFYALGAVKDFNSLALTIQHIHKIIDDAIEDIKPDYIFTHNPIGEYGHPTHKLLFDIVSQHHLTKNIIFTDISFSTHYHSYEDITPFIKDTFYLNNYIHNRTFTIDLDFYNRCRAIYQQHSCWTWNTNKPKGDLAECNLHILKSED